MRRIVVAPGTVAAALTGPFRSPGAAAPAAPAGPPPRRHSLPARPGGSEPVCSTPSRWVARVRATYRSLVP